MKISSELKMLFAVISITGVILVLAALVITKPAPSLTRSDLVPADAHTKGNAKSSVYLVEFSDFQCPACAAVKPLVDDIMKTYGDKILFVYRHYPLPQHPLAQKAAQAAEAAGAQGKFWEMFDLIFAKSESLTESDFTDFANKLGLDETKFATDIKNGTFTSRVQSDIDAGNKVNLNATPTFFLNGKKLELTSLNDLKTSVEQAINK
jgi:protein-disulfide isomerase